MSEGWTVVGKPKAPKSNNNNSQGGSSQGGAKAKAAPQQDKQKDNYVPGWNGPMRSQGANQFQDFTPVILQRKQTKQELGSKEQQVNRARQQGKAIDTEKRFEAGHNKQKAAPVYARKVDEAEDAQHLPTVSMEVRKAIQAGRQTKNWTQKDLAQQINEVPRVVNDYESGKAVPVQSVLEKMERALGVKLRGKDIGTPAKH